MADAITKMLSGAKVPRFYKTAYALCKDEITDIEKCMRDALARPGTLERIPGGARVAITAGSRDINNLGRILLALIDELKRAGAKPFIFPAMGSHGGATAEGQRAVLAEYGITEQTMQVPILSSMETAEVGKTDEGVPVHADKTALEADFIIPVGRIKPHPEFRGEHESGLVKMLAIGLGKQYGANICHQLGMSNMSQNVLKLARVLLRTCSIPFGVGIIENAVHGTYAIDAIPSEHIIDEEPKLLRKAKELVPVIPFEKVDVIICEEMGKDLSGTGMDSNVIGRSISLGVSRPFAERIAIFDLTDKSHGNFNGVGLGDVISRRLYEKMSFSETYPNTITGCELLAVKIPPVMENDKLCVQFCIEMCLDADKRNMRMVWIRNTLSLHSFYISEALLGEVRANPLLSTGGTALRVLFGASGSFAGFEPYQQEGIKDA